jgi:hypothetical protein
MHHGSSIPECDSPPKNVKIINRRPPGKMTGNGEAVPVGKWLVYAGRCEVIGFCEI